jgi:translation initiation factor 2 subunit 1
MESSQAQYDHELEEKEDDTFGLDHVPNCNLKCRFYENQYPQEGEVLMGKWVRVDKNTCAYVTLVEYNNIEALIMFSEISRKRTKSVHRLIKIGKNGGKREPLLVTKVDEERGFIDLSRKRVNPEDVKECEERYNKHLKAHNIMKQTAAWLEEDLLSLYERLGWPLSREFGSLNDAFLITLNDPETVFTKVDCDEKTKQLLLDNINKRMKPVNSKICATFEITCYTFEGIDAVKRALKESLSKMKVEGEEGDVDSEIHINLIRSPLYECSTHRSAKIQEGIDQITLLLKHIEDHITESKGKFNLSKSSA